MQTTTEVTAEEAPLVPTTKFFVQYRGKCTEDFARSLHKYKAPCTVILTLRKMKTVLPSLKPQVERVLKSGLVYKIECPLCKECYVGQTRRHLKVRFDEHLSPSKAVKKHMIECGSEITVDNVEILKTTSKGEDYLLTLEALFITELKPKINTKDEYRSRELTLKIY